MPRGSPSGAGPSVLGLTGGIDTIWTPRLMPVDPFLHGPLLYMATFLPNSVVKVPIFPVLKHPQIGRKSET